MYSFSGTLLNQMSRAPNDAIKVLFLYQHNRQYICRYSRRSASLTAFLKYLYLEYSRYSLTSVGLELVCVMLRTSTVASILMLFRADIDELVKATTKYHESMDQIAISKDGSQIPVVDLQSPTAPSELLRAATDNGFIFIKHTESTIAASEVDGMFGVSRKFFSAPDEVKSACSINSSTSGKNHGWLSIGTETLDPEKHKVI